MSHDYLTTLFKKLKQSDAKSLIVLVVCILLYANVYSSMANISNIFPTPYNDYLAIAPFVIILAVAIVAAYVIILNLVSSLKHKQKTK